MLETYARDFFGLGSLLNSLLSSISMGIIAKPDIGGKALGVNIGKDFRNRLIEMRQWCEVVHLVYPLELMDQLLNTSLEQVTHNDVVQSLAELKKSISFELKSVMFLHIPSDKVGYYASFLFLGVEVCDKFPSARNEIMEAGKCYALGLNTACVFHLMRAVEVALKCMVVEMKAHPHLPKPAELCDWDTLIRGLRAALTVLERGKSTDPIIKATHKFYSEAISTFAEFKDAWRNTVSHGHEVSIGARKLYKPGETEDIIKSTKHFMSHLATRIKE